MNEASAALLSAMPFAELLGVELLEAAPDVVRIQIEWTPERYTAGGLLHGAVLTGLADICGGLGFLNLPKGAVGTATIESKTNTLRGVRSGRRDGASPSPRPHDDRHRDRATRRHSTGRQGHPDTDRADTAHAGSNLAAREFEAAHGHKVSGARRHEGCWVCQAFSP